MVACRKSSYARRGGSLMPKRQIDPSICTSRSLSSISAEADRLMFRLLVNTDPLGRSRCSASSVKENCLPRLDVTLQQIEGWLQELHRVDTIHLYEVDGLRYMHFVNFEKYNTQLKHERRSSLPPCPLCPDFSSGSVRKGIRSPSDERPNAFRTPSEPLTSTYTSTLTLPSVVKVEGGCGGEEDLTAVKELKRVLSAHTDYPFATAGSLPDPANIERQRQLMDQAEMLRQREQDIERARIVRELLNANPEPEGDQDGTKANN